LSMMFSAVSHFPVHSSTVVRVGLFTFKNNFRSPADNNDTRTSFERSSSHLYVAWISERSTGFFGWSCAIRIVSTFRCSTCVTSRQDLNARRGGTTILNAIAGFCVDPTVPEPKAI
jgi:hypothetical protein